MPGLRSVVVNPAGKPRGCSGVSASPADDDSNCNVYLCWFCPLLPCSPPRRGAPQISVPQLASRHHDSLGNNNLNSYTFLGIFPANRYNLRCAEISACVCRQGVYIVRFWCFVACWANCCSGESADGRN